MLNRTISLAIAAVLATTLSACGDDSSSPAPTPAPAPAPTPAAQYEVTLSNLTAGQPLSPPVVIAHGAQYKLFTIGQPASVALERLAEGAQTAALDAQATADADVRSTAVSTSGPIGPGSSSTLTLEVVNSADLSDLRLSLASMLVNTNDAITAINGHAISALTVGQSTTMTLTTYDAGTEVDSEVAQTIPGPAGGGEGFNAARDDIADMVLGHAGVITADDGLSTSALRSIHRWLGPVARVTVRRVQ